MGPLAGVMVCDYYFIAKGKLSIPEMYNPTGIYSYSKVRRRHNSFLSHADVGDASQGWNWRAYVAFIVPVALLL